MHKNALLPPYHTRAQYFCSFFVYGDTQRLVPQHNGTDSAGSAALYNSSSHKQCNARSALHTQTINLCSLAAQEAAATSTAQQQTLYSLNAVYHCEATGGLVACLSCWVLLPKHTPRVTGTQVKSAQLPCTTTARLTRWAGATRATHTNT